MLPTRLDPVVALVAVNAAGVLAVGMEFTVARCLRAWHADQRSREYSPPGEDLPPAAPPPFDFTVATRMTALTPPRYAAR